MGGIFMISPICEIRQDSCSHISSESFPAHLEPRSCLLSSLRARVPSLPRRLAGPVAVQDSGARRKKLCEIELVPEVLPEVTEDALQKALGPEHVSVSADEARLHLHVRAERLG